MSSAMEPHPSSPKRKQNDQKTPIQESDRILLIPNELITELLSRLPAKSLVRFKCVSKSWFSLISSPQFIKSHLAVATGSDDYKCHTLICTVEPENSCEYYHELYSVNSLLYTPADEIPTPVLIDIGFELGVLGGRLSLFYDHENTGDLWLMKEYGDKDSWSKLASIPYIDPPAEIHFFGKSQSVCLLGNGGILFVLRSVLMFYDPKRNTFRKYPQIGPLENVPNP